MPPCLVIQKLFVVTALAVWATKVATTNLTTNLDSILFSNNDNEEERVLAYIQV